MSARIIETWRDPYDEGWNICRKEEITFNSGLTVLVGCNGAGKSTLLHNIKDKLNKDNVPCIYFDNRTDGDHSNSIGSAMMRGDIAFAATAWMSSEGENISLNLSTFATELREFILTGLTKKDKLSAKWQSIFGDNDSTKKAPNVVDACNERWILLDAIDSGYSIDNVIGLKNLFSAIIDDGQHHGVDVYIIVSCNEYELANDSPCFDVIEGEYLTFDSYEAYKKFILKSKDKKIKRLEKSKKK